MYMKTGGRVTNLCKCMSRNANELLCLIQNADVLSDS